MKLPPHLLTKLSIASVVGTVAVVATLDRWERTECQPTAEAAVIAEDSTPLVERVPTFVVTPAVAPLPPPPPPRHLMPRPKLQTTPRVSTGCGPCGKG